jgi:hypothetical protein
MFVGHTEVGREPRWRGGQDVAPVLGCEAGAEIERALNAQVGRMWNPLSIE